jgi:hypothetical protein
MYQVFDAAIVRAAIHLPWPDLNITLPHNVAREA